MSINLENPETVLGKVDAAANFLAQIRLAMMIGDGVKAMGALIQAERLLFAAQSQIEEDEEQASVPAMCKELAAHIATLTIHGDNIGGIRARLLMPFDCLWNGWVRDLTAARELELAGRAAAEGSADETGEAKSGAGSASDEALRTGAGGDAS